MAKKPDTTTAPAVPAAPTGQRLSRAGGPGTLRPGIQEEVITTKKPQYCGRIVGQAGGFRVHPNSKDASKESICFSGDFMFMCHDGQKLRMAECYVPSVIGNGMRARLSRPDADPIAFAFEVWAEYRPDAAMKFEYVLYNIAPDEFAPSPALAIAAALGLVEQPARVLTGPREDRANVDPETGEVIG